MFVIAAFAVSGLNPIRDLVIVSAPVGAPTARNNEGASTHETGEASILKPMTLPTVGSADAIAVLTVANTGPHIPKLASTTPPTCDSGARATAWPPWA
jgi:hypothetical protein